MRLDIDFEIPTWNKIYNMLLRLAKKIQKEKFLPDLIVGISRGGWIPARVMSDLLNNNNITDVKVEFYIGIGETRNKPIMDKSSSVSMNDKKILILDDVSDTGKSLKLVKDYIYSKGALEIKTATIYCKPHSNLIPDYYIKKTEKWIIFPWELKETIRYLIKSWKEKEVSIEIYKERLIESGINASLAERFLNEVEKEIK
jgi:hypoxanthine phosphoribosyltransferase